MAKMKSPQQHPAARKASKLAKKAQKRVKRSAKVVTREAKRIGKLGKTALELRTIRHDMESEFQKIGRRVFSLSKRAGEHDVHPAFERFKTIENSIQRLATLDKKYQKDKMKLARLKQQ